MRKYGSCKYFATTIVKSNDMKKNSSIGFQNVDSNIAVILINDIQKEKTKSVVENQPMRTGISGDK